MMQINKEEFKVKVTEALKKLRKFQEPDHVKAAIQMINSFGPFVALWVLAYFLWDVSKWAVVGISILNAFFLVRIFIIQHDCGHQNFVKSRFWRNFIGQVCSLMSFIPYKYWASSHHFHHNNNGRLEVRDIGDIETLTVEEYHKLSSAAKFRYRIFRSVPVMFVIGPLYYILIHNRLPLISMPEFKKERIGLLLSNLMLVGLVVGLCFVLDWQKVLMVQFFVLMFFGIVAIWFFYVQHQHEHGYKHWKDKWEFMMAAIKGSTYYKLPRLMNWLTGNIAIHHIHHLNPAIPNYHLRACADEVPFFHKFATQVTFFQSLKFAFHKLWDEDSERMITFKEYRKLQRNRMAA